MNGGLAAPRFAVECHGQDLGRCGLSGTTRAGKQVGVADPVLSDGVDQGARDVILAHDIFEPDGPVLAVQRYRHLVAPILTNVPQKWQSDRAPTVEYELPGADR